MELHVSAPENETVDFLVALEVTIAVPIPFPSYGAISFIFKLLAVRKATKGSPLAFVPSYAPSKML